MCRCSCYPHVTLSARSRLCWLEEVTKICEEKSLEKGEDTANVLIMRTDFHNHLRNVRIGAITKHLSKYLDDILACEFEASESRYRVYTMIDAVLRSI